MTTKIEWTDETWNPVTGCTKVSQGCKNCYAERLWPKVEGAERKREHWDWAKVAPRAFTEVNVHPDRFYAPLHWRKPRRVFVNSMSDLFHEDVGDLALLEIFDVMRQCENGWTPHLGGEQGKLVASHTFQILTKRPQRMHDFCTRLRFGQNDGRGLYLAQNLPHNGFNPMRALRHIWLGVSVEDQATADERIPLLLQTPAAVRFVSYEPALGPVDFTYAANQECKHETGYQEPDTGAWICRRCEENTELGIDWLIAGGESGPNARPAHPDWFRSARDQCAAAGVPFFFKQWGEFGPSPDAGLPDHLPSNAGHYFEAPHAPHKVWKFGKKAAGRLLDGREHSEYPA